MFEKVFKNIDDILYKDPGADSELDYVAQTSWVLFLRYLDEIEKEKADEATLSGDHYDFLIKDEFRWSSWAMPKGESGKVDHHIALTGPDLVDFVDQKLNGDINVTSPTGLKTLFDLSGINLAKTFWKELKA